MNISFKSLWRICFIGILIFGLIYFRHIILMFVASLILAASMENIINWLEKKKIHRIISTILVYIFLIFAITGLLYIVLPPLFENISALFSKLPETIQSTSIISFFEKYLPFINSENLLNNVFTNDSALGYVGNLVKNFSGIIISMSNFLLIILIAFYLSIEKNWFKNVLEMFLPKYYKKYFIQLWENAQKKMVFWLYSQLVLSIFITSLSIVIFYIMDIEYPLLSAIILGLLDFIPFIGPIIATIIVIVINAANNMPQAGALLLVCLILQYIQNIFGPYIRSKFLKVDPIVTLFFIAIFGKFGGALGVFVAIPLSTTIVEFLKDLNDQKICDERFDRLL